MLVRHNEFGGYARPGPVARCAILGCGVPESDDQSTRLGQRTIGNWNLRAYFADAFLHPAYHTVRASGSDLVLSATDLSNFLGCRHRTAIEMLEARGQRRRPYHDDPLLELLFQRGIDHEQSYVASLREAGRQIVDLSGDASEATRRTLEAMRSGAEVIVQGAFSEALWFGRPDVLRRVDTESSLGAWSYEVVDTKLARETRAGTILQLGLYSELLAAAQGKRPERFHVVTPAPVAPIYTYRVDDYVAYVRLIRSQLRATVNQDADLVAAENYPDPVDLCDVCPWYRECSEKRHRDDHLSLVAGITRLQRRNLEAHNIHTLTALAHLPESLPFVRIRDQAKVQLESRHVTPPVYALRDVEEGKGLCRLPEPCPGDVFLDLEGDPFAVEGGREYLFGVVVIGDDGTPCYRSFWGLTDQDEREAFESVVDLMVDAWRTHEAMHIYHYAPYEPSAFKRLMGRYATREEELDRLLRAERFIDLYAVVRQAMLVGVERYSIKNLEPLYGFTREVALDDASRYLRVMEQALELNAPDAVPAEVRAAVEGYNKDDCLSTLRLRHWLEEVRNKAQASGAVLPRPPAMAGTPSREISDRERRVEELRARLLAGIPEVAADRSAEQRAIWLLAYLLDWHRREDKAAWWDYFRLRDLSDEELMDEPQAISGLEFAARVKIVTRAKGGKPTGSVIDRYRFPVQEMEIGPKDELKCTDGTPFGKVERVDRVARTIDVRKGPAQANAHPTAVFAHTHFSTGVLEDAIFGIAEEIAAGVAGVGTKAQAVRDLLLARAPRLRSGRFVCGDNGLDSAVQTVRDLDHTVLAIQGPPGSGKTFCGARMILELVAQGKKVGVLAASHKVIRNLLDAVARAAAERGQTVALAHKWEDDGVGAGASGVTVVSTNEDALDALRAAHADVLGGTAWMWARDEFVDAVDVLFIDEAGQIALANVVAVSRAARNLVLLGDPRQLEQPRKGSHPDGVNVSALQHILGEHLTIPPERGIFLPITWRLAPSICAFTSELFYEGKLRAKPGLEHQCLIGTGAFDGAGLWMVDVDHDANRNFAPKEVDVVADIVARLTAPGAQWTNERGEGRPLTGQDILVVAPYNAQVSRLAERLAAAGVRSGTVDKFQGQEAPVVIYTMTTSRPEDAPRGMEFLYSPNRLNVATSRARCAVVLVASPKLFAPECRTPRQMRLANALCRFREMAHIPGGEDG